jgi:hypothetical protein
MKDTIALIIVCLIAGGCRRTEHNKELFSAPEGVTYEIEEGLEFHTFSWGDGNNISVFMVYPHPAGLSQPIVPWMANQMSQKFEPRLEAINGIESFTKTSSEVCLGIFSGQQIDFLITMNDRNTIHQCIYVLWDGERVWQGQLTGLTDNDITMVHRILATSAR